MAYGRRSNPFRTALVGALAGWGIAAAALAGPYDPPPGYYATATGAGATLKSQLHDIIDGHTFVSYDAARSALQVTDRDPADPGRMLLVYSRQSLDVASINPGGSIPGWDSGGSWDREHTWPRSRGVGSSGNDNSDLHQLRPSNPSVNSSRGNKNFGGAFGAQPFGAVAGTGFWYPGDADAGMIARQQFYMAVRYDGSDGSTTDLELAPGDTSLSNRLGDLNALVEWHYAAAPDDFERRRNQVVYDAYQGNRNPFVDHPEWAWSVFVDQANDTQLSLAGGAASASGASTLAIDLGRVYAGQAAPGPATVTLNKAGDDGAYYRVTTTGDAFTSAGEHARPVALGAGVSDSFDVGLGVSTALSGLYGGTVVVDNLDVTTGGGAGRGANDGDDVVNLSLAVLDHPVASWSGDSLLTEVTVDFGAVPLGSGVVSAALELFNFAGVGAPTLAADLDVDSFVATGDGATLGLDLTPTLGLAQGASLAFDALLDTAVAGLFSAVYTVSLSGEDLPGEQTQQLTVNLVGEVTASTPGDYNGDGLVNAADYSVWRDTRGSTTLLAADGDGDGEIDDDDYVVWTGGYNATHAQAIPEPATGASLAVAAALLARRSRRRAASAE